MRNENKPESNKQYLLVGKSDAPSIANGNTWKESEVVPVDSVLTFAPVVEMLSEGMYSPLKVGDVLYSSWGYEQTNVDFYVITRRTKCTVTLAPVHSIVVENVAWAHDKVVADMEHAKWMINHEHHAQSKTDDSCLNNKRIKWDGTEHVQVKISSFQYAWVDDGTPKTRTSYA
tara:strand:+ start:775 stop:1293 length:519 start_codon:yes stop_codon:yes gene_type:complete